MINRTNLIEIIGKTPGLRTVQICDLLDCDMEELMAALELVSSANGPVVGYNTQAPNGRPATAWRLAGIAAPSVAPSLSPPVPKDPAWLSTKVPLSNVEKAIAFINGNGGSATGSELHKLLGLQASHYPSTYLGAGLKDGRLIKNGAKWTLGSSTPPLKEEPKIPDIPVPKDVDEAIKPIIEKVPDLAPIPKNCRETGGHPTCDMCMKGEYEKCRYTNPAALPFAVQETAREMKIGLGAPEHPPAPAASMDPTGAFHAEISDDMISVLREQWEADMLAIEAANINPAPEFLCALCSNGELRLERRGEKALILSKEELSNLRAYLSCVNMYDLARLKF